MASDNKIFSIGGVGGSGTRLVAQILSDLGLYIGSDINVSNDNLLFTLLFKRQDVLVQTDVQFDALLAIFTSVMSGERTLTDEENRLLKTLASSDRTLHDKMWLLPRLDFLKNSTVRETWAWKEPNTHIIIEQLLHKMEHLKFIYVYRNGLDMAFSNNQNQLKLWGKIFFNDYDMKINPHNSLRYWCMAHQRVLKLKDQYPEKILMLDFDRLCEDPKENILQLLKFLEYDVDESRLKELQSLVKAPASIGRHKHEDLTQFAKEDLAYIKGLYNSTTPVPSC